MAPAELARQVVCVGFGGTSASDAPLRALRELGVAGAILFARNVGSADLLSGLVADLHNALGAADGTPPLIAIDQEGGQVARIGEGVVELPAMMALGATRSAPMARAAGVRLGADLARFGINVDFAPVLDLALEPRNTVIGARAFGEDPQLVAQLGAAFAQGLAASGVVAVGKHFPGHGATEVDSHFALPVLAVDAATWGARDLVPFAHAIQSGLRAIMSAHVVLPALDAHLPATLSRPILHGVLREELGFDGVIFTDCLEMQPIATNGVAEAAPRALAAGADCVLISHRIDLAQAAIASIEGAVQDGTLSRARLEEAASRVHRLRASARVRRSIIDDASGDVGLEIARAAVTVLRGSPALEQGDAVTVVSFEEAERPSFSAALRARKIKSEIMRVVLDPSEDDLNLLEMVLRGLGERMIVIVTRRAHLHPRQAEAVKRILGIAPNAVVISAREPYDAGLWEAARNLACIYDDGRISLEGLADVMTGKAVPAGTLPVHLDPAAIR